VTGIELVRDPHLHILIEKICLLDAGKFSVADILFLAEVGRLRSGIYPQADVLRVHAIAERLGVT